MTDQERITQPFEVRAESVLACAFYGIHHCPHIKKIPGPFQRWEVLSHDDLASFDFDALTRFVIMAHDNCVRVSIRPAGRLLKIVLHPRNGRKGYMNARHPTMEEAVLDVRSEPFQPKSQL